MFDKMMNSDFRKEFIDYKDSRFRSDEIRQKTEEYILSDKCVEDICRLKEGDYFFSVPIKRIVPKNNSDKKRIIFRFAENETALMRLMAYAFQDLDFLYSDGLYSFRRGSSAQNYLKSHKESRIPKDAYAVKADIKSYGSSLNIEILTAKINRFFDEDTKVRDFLIWLLNRKKYIDMGKEVEGDTAGLPGCPIHNLFTNIYLLELDDKFAGKCISYCRYSDDILIYVDSEQKAMECYEQVKEIVSDLRLTLNESKTRICYPNERIEFLGMELGGEKIDIAPTSINKLKRRMRMRARRIERIKREKNLRPEEAARILIATNNSMFFGHDKEIRMSWKRWAFPVITCSEGLKSLDLFNQHCIRYVMTGKWSNSQYRVKYDELKKLGYRSLVREYYEEWES